jgi:hypothetical protein
MAFDARCGFCGSLWLKLRVFSKLASMDSRFLSTLAAPIEPVVMQRLPAWASARQHDLGEADAAFTAGIALKTLDDLVRTQPVWAGG